MYHISVTVPNTSEPVTVAKLKQFLRLNDEANEEDSLLQSFIITARKIFETRTGLVLNPVTIKQYIPELPRCNQRNIYLVRPPVNSIVAFKYFDNSDVEQVYTDYNSDLTGMPGEVWSKTSFPHTSTKKRPQASIEYTAGYATIPEDIRTGIMLGAAHYYENRSTFSAQAFTFKEMPYGFESLINLYHTGIYGDLSNEGYWQMDNARLVPAIGYAYSWGYR